MQEEEEVDLDIFVEDVMEEKKYLISVPPKVKCKELNKKLELLFETKYFEFRYRDKLYSEDQILKFEQGDTILFYKKEPPKEETQDIDELKKAFTINKYSGLLRLCLVKFIADKISDLKIVKNNDIANVILELKTFIEFKIDENNQIIFIKATPNKKWDIISYSEILCSKIDEKEINYLIEILDDITTKEIYNFANRLSIYESYIKFFEEELLEDLKNSYFIYKILGIELLPIKNNKEYFEHSQNCKNKITKYLYHEIPQDSSKQFNNNNFLYYSKKPYYGMGIYFSDKLDYIAYQTSINNIINENDEIVPICDNFSLNVSQIYYDNSLKKDINDFKYLTPELDHYPSYDEIAKNYKDKMVKKDGINIAQVKSDSRQLISSDNLKINLDKGQFITNEYVITEKEQILPLFNLHMERKDYLIIWRDQNFENKNSNMDKSKQLCKEYFIKDAKMQFYYVLNIEEGLEIIKKKRFNKIILISNIGLDLSGKKFIEIARQILGFPIIAFFFSVNKKHLSWIKDFPNALFSGDIELLKKYINNYNKKDLLNLKKKVEKKNKIELTFNEDFIKYPKYIDNKNYKELLYEEICPNFKKVIIKNIKNSNALYFGLDGNISFKRFSNKTDDYNRYIWTVTILDNEITLFSNFSYLVLYQKEKKVDKGEFMEVWNIEKHENYYLIYYKDKSTILTDQDNDAIVNKPNKNNYNQLFSLCDIAN